MKKSSQTIGFGVPPPGRWLGAARPPTLSLAGQSRWTSWRHRVTPSCLADLGIRIACLHCLKGRALACCPATYHHLIHPYVHAYTHILFVLQIAHHHTYIYIHIYSVSPHRVKYLFYRTDSPPSCIYIYIYTLFHHTELTSVLPYRRPSFTTLGKPKILMVN